MTGPEQTRLLAGIIIYLSGAGFGWSLRALWEWYRLNPRKSR